MFCLHFSTSFNALIYTLSNIYYRAAMV